MERIKIPKGASIKYYPEDSVIEIIPADIKEEFEVGKWYKHESGVLGLFLEIGFNFGTPGEVHMSSISEWELATDKEVERALIKEAEKRGYKKGVKCKVKNATVNFRLPNIETFCDFKGGWNGLYIKTDHITRYPLFDAEKGWAEIINPDYTNSLKEVFYYGDAFYWVDKKTMKILEDELNEKSPLLPDNEYSTEIMTKASAEKCIEDNKPKREKGYYKVIDGGDWTVAEYDGEFWYYIGSESRHEDNEVHEIGDKIELN